MNELIGMFADPDNEFKKSYGEKFYTPRIQSFIQQTQVLKTTLWNKVLGYEFNSPRGPRYATEFISIDKFIHEQFKGNPEIIDIAKYIISYLIVGAEGALLHKIEKCYEPWIDSNWVNELFHKLQKYSPILLRDNIYVLTFNYERTFEFFAERYFKKYFNQISIGYLKDFFNSNVRHVYGSIGSLELFPFGETPNNDGIKMREIYKNLNLMCEERNGIPSLLSNSYDQIFFLGFGYDDVNLSVLNINQVKNYFRAGTGHGISDEKINELEEEYQIRIPLSRPSIRTFISDQIF